MEALGMRKFSGSWGFYLHFILNNLDYPLNQKV